MQAILQVVRAVVAAEQFAEPALVGCNQALLAAGENCASFGKVA
jgi:hypothetical protein